MDEVAVRAILRDHSVACQSWLYDVLRPAWGAVRRSSGATSGPAGRKESAPLLSPGGVGPTGGHPISVHGGSEEGRQYFGRELHDDLAMLLSDVGACPDEQTPCCGKPRLTFTAPHVLLVCVFQPVHVDSPTARRPSRSPSPHDGSHTAAAPTAEALPPPDRHRDGERPPRRHISRAGSSVEMLAAPTPHDREGSGGGIGSGDNGGSRASRARADDSGDGFAAQLARRIDGPDLLEHPAWRAPRPEAAPMTATTQRERCISALQALHGIVVEVAVAFRDDAPALRAARPVLSQAVETLCQRFQGVSPASHGGGDGDDDAAVQEFNASRASLCRSIMGATQSSDAEAAAVGRELAWEQHVVPLLALRPSEDLRILFVGSNPPTAPPVLYEEQLRELLRADAYATLRVEPMAAPRLADLTAKLTSFRPHIVHFSGHSGPGGLLLWDDSRGRTTEVPVALIAAAVRDAKAAHSGLMACVFNSCNSSVLANAVHEHVDFVAGTDMSITNDWAKHFAVGFYCGVAAGLSLLAAYRWGLTRMRAMGCPSHVMTVRVRPAPPDAAGSVAHATASTLAYEPGVDGGSSREQSNVVNRMQDLASALREARLGALEARERAEAAKLRLTELDASVRAATFVWDGVESVITHLGKLCEWMLQRLKDDSGVDADAFWREPHAHEAAVAAMSSRAIVGIATDAVNQALDTFRIVAEAAPPATATATATAGAEAGAGAGAGAASGGDRTPTPAYSPATIAAARALLGKVPTFEFATAATMATKAEGKVQWGALVAAQAARDAIVAERARLADAHTEATAEVRALVTERVPALERQAVDAESAITEGLPELMVVAAGQKPPDDGDEAAAARMRALLEESAVVSQKVAGAAAETVEYEASAAAIQRLSRAMDAYVASFR